MRYLYKDIVFKEVPNETTLVYAIAGCPLRCKGCHSPELRNNRGGTFLSTRELKDDINKYFKFITCVCFMGGDWHGDELCTYLDLIRKDYPKLKTCLYSGYTTVSDALLDRLDFVKVGPYVEELGGLENPKTNQRFYRVEDQKDLTKEFLKENYKLKTYV